MSKPGRRDFIKTLGAAIAGIAVGGAAGGYVAGSQARDRIESLEKELKEAKEKLLGVEKLEKEVRVYNFEAYIHPYINTLFEETTGTKVIYDVFEATDECLAKFTTGGGGYDIVVFTGGTIPISDYEEYAQPLDHSKIPNVMKYIFDELKNPAYDPRRKFTAPYQSGTSGITYNTVRIDEEDHPEGWLDSLFDFDHFLPKYKGKCTMIPGGVETIPNVIKGALGHSINDLRPEIVEEAVQLMIKQKPYLATYAGTEEYITGLEAERFWCSETWSYLGARPTCEYVVPVEGCEIWTDNMVVPKNPPHLNAAYAWINFISEPTVQAAITIYNGGYMTPNKRAFEMLPEDMQTDEAIYPPSEVLAKLEPWEGRTPEQRQMLTEAWSRIMAA